PDGPLADREIAEGDTIPFGGGVLEAWHTPGHTRDHLAFAVADSATVFGGDLVATEGYIIIDPPDGDMTDYLASLRRVRDHFEATARLGLLLPGHGAPIEAPAELLDRYITHRLEREARVLDCLTKETALTTAEILPSAYADTPVAL